MCLIFQIRTWWQAEGSPYLWQMQEHQQEEILTHLAEAYGLEEKDTGTLSDALMAVAREMVADSLEEYLDGLEYAAEGTYLEDLDEVTVRSDFRQLATDSVYYMLCRTVWSGTDGASGRRGFYAYYRL